MTSLMSDGKSTLMNRVCIKKRASRSRYTNMYKNREPVYQDIIPAKHGKIDKKIYFYKGMPDNSKADMSYSGYLLYKGMNRDLLNQGNNPNPSIVQVCCFVWPILFVAMQRP